MRVNGTQTQNIENVWYSGDFTGNQRPTARATIHKGNVRLTSGGALGDFASIIFSVGAEFKNGLFTYYPREIPNIKSVSWNRDTTTPVASATIEIYNVMSMPDGTIERGYFTWNRGDSSFDKARGIGRIPAWYGMLVPDNVIRTFEGYGADYTVGPETDSHSLCTGNWLIDKVDISGGIITVTARDFGRILIDQILFPPITPRSSPIPGIAYPISFDSFQKTSYTNEAYTPLFMNFLDSSSTPWVGHDGYQLGHYAREAMDGNQDTYWLSVGNGAPNASYAYEWIEGATGGETIGSINIHALYANLQGYVSVFAHGAWVNKIGVIPYDAAGIGAPNGSDVPAVARFTTSGLNQRVNFDPIAGVTAVRVTFTNLQDSGVGPFVYRAGVREFGVYAAKAVQGVKTTKPGDFNYSDYTDIIKLFCAWGGFHWPKPSDLPFVAVSWAPGNPQGIAFPIDASPANDTYLKNGRIWGDLEETGTYGAVSLTIDNFDKKTIMDGITTIQDTVGFLFYVDESGGVQWRFPNYKARGNLVGGRRAQRFIRILDTQTLTGVTSTLDSRNARERVYIASPDGKFVGGARGYNLNPIGLRRISGWIDAHWTSNAECQTASELIAVQQMMTYRTVSVVIPGLPTMQMDDQFELVDTANGEGWLYYLQGVQSKLDHESGEYSYTLSAAWLGSRADGAEWAFDKYGGVSPNTQVLLDTYDKYRKDGVYNSFAPVVVPIG